MMRKIWLHGRLAERFGEVYDLDVVTAGEAVRALHCNFPTFIDELKEGSFQFIRGDEETGFDLDLDEVCNFKLGDADLHIIPVIEGEKSRVGGIIKAVVGVALIGAAIFFSGGAAGGLVAALGQPIAGGALFGATFGNMAALGLAITLVGVSSALTPHKTAEKDKADKNDQSYDISGPGNTYEQGNPVPIIYGEGIFGSVAISIGKDVDPIPVGWNPITGIYTG
jgi:predicted phage tail protein